MPGVGHIILEVDRFFRKEHLKELDPHKKYIFLTKNHEAFKVFVNLYGDRFYYAKVSSKAYYLLLPVFMRYSDITIDMGVSRMKIQLPKGDLPILWGYSFTHQLSVRQALRQHQQAYANRIMTSNFFPLIEYKKKAQSLPFLNHDKICLVHIKTSSVNATALHTDPNTYLPALQYMSDKGYYLVFVGREEMPTEFVPFNIFNYSQSRFATFENDITVFSKADIAIIGGSGTAFLADCYDIPFLYINSWHLAMSMPSFKCISVPCLLSTQLGQALSFPEQMAAYINTNTMHECPPSECTFRNASADEILEALKELLALKGRKIDRSPLQERFQNQDDQGLLAVSRSRISDYFIKKHQHLL